MSFVLENIPDSPRMAPEKYGMYVVESQVKIFIIEALELLPLPIDPSITVTTLTLLSPFSDDYIQPDPPTPKGAPVRQDSVPIETAPPIPPHIGR